MKKYLIFGLLFLAGCEQDTRITALIQSRSELNREWDSVKIDSAIWEARRNNFMAEGKNRMSNMTSEQLAAFQEYDEVYDNIVEREKAKRNMATTSIDVNDIESFFARGEAIMNDRDALVAKIEAIKAREANLQNTAQMLNYQLSMERQQRLQAIRQTLDNLNEMNQRQYQQDLDYANSFNSKTRNYHARPDGSGGYNIQAQ